MLQTIGVFNMQNENIEKERKRTFYWRFLVVILFSFAVTYGVYWISLKFGNYGLFVSGAITGAIWGEIWHMWLYENPGKKLYSQSRLFFIALIIISILIIAFLLWYYPLPQIR